jgi:hypothetical protein
VDHNVKSRRLNIRIAEPTIQQLSWLMLERGYTNRTAVIETAVHQLYQDERSKMTDYTARFTKAADWLVRDSAGRERARFATEAEAQAWIDSTLEQEREDQAAREQSRSEQALYDASIPDLSTSQLRWQVWRNWFYDKLVRTDRRLGQQQDHLDRIPDGSIGEPGTAGSHSYASQERHLINDRQQQQQAHELYRQAVALDTEIKAARRARDTETLRGLLDGPADGLISQMGGFFLAYARPE